MSDTAVSTSGGKNKVVAALLALLFGSLGIHRFYLGQLRGLLYILFIWTLIPSFIAFVEAILFLLCDDAKWDAKYGSK